MGELVRKDNQEQLAKVTDLDKLEIVDEAIRKKYLTRLSEMKIVEFGDNLSLEDDLISNVRMYRITEMVYQKGESVTEKFTTVFNTLSTYDATVFIVIDSDGNETNFYLGVRSNDDNRSMVTLGDTLKNTLVGNFPGAKIVAEDRDNIAQLSNRIISQGNVASVSVVGNGKNENQENERFVQGLEKLALAMYGRQYTGIIIAQNQSPQTIQQLRKNYQDIYTKISPYAKVQSTFTQSRQESRQQSFSEMDGKQKAAMIGSAFISLAGGAVGAAIGAATGGAGTGIGAMMGGQLAGQLNGFIGTLAPIKQVADVEGQSEMTTLENKTVVDMMTLLDENIKRIDEFDSYGMWNVAGYFTSNDMSTAEIAASNYRSLMNGEKTGRQVSAINSWRKSNLATNGNFEDLTSFLSRYTHPLFNYGGDIFLDASTSVSGKDLGLHMGLPRKTVPGLPVIEHAEFGKEVDSYSLFRKNISSRPEDRMTLGKVFDLGQVTKKVVELDNRSLNMHTFITGSTGSGKSNTVYQILTELHQDQIPFLVIEPAKGEYKDVFGNWEDVNVYSTNPNVAELININPFKFPSSIHVLEHVDGLVEIFGVCWPMYDAMPAFFKDAILRSYEAVGWDLGSSTFDGDDLEYPDFDILGEQLSMLIENSDYASDIKSNYRGALLTRVKSLTVGLNKFIFTSRQTEYEKIFDQNCILDISRVKSSETKALLMGLMVYILNEYRMDQKTSSNNALKHVTVLEEAHNLLKNIPNGNASELMQKSVEMITNTIAEIRTYGEGFVIVDQSPSSVDIASIKNTNTKIVLRTPEANDREAVGRSIGLNEDQVNEIAKLPSGVAVVYQNDWINPVLTKINKAEVLESTYQYNSTTEIMPVKDARTVIIRAIMEPWMHDSSIDFVTLSQALISIDMSRNSKKLLSVMIYTYKNHNGHLVWDEKSICVLKGLLFEILCISKNQFETIVETGNPNLLRKEIMDKTKGFSQEEIEEICHILTMEV